MKIKVWPGLLLLLGLGLGPAGCWAEEAQLYFDPQIRPQIRKAIAQAKQTIAVEVYKMTDREVIGDLIQAGQRGLSIRILLCPSQTENHRTAARLKKSGIQVRWYPLLQPEQIMHLKMAVFDGQQIIFGSPNWTHWGMTLHHEGILSLRDSEVVKKAETQFQADWQKSSTRWLEVQPVKNNRRFESRE